jgi:hypothetical protein
LNSLGESKEAAIGYEPDVVPPAPDDVEPPAEVVPPERVERRVAGLRADVARDADPPDDEADRDEEDRDDGVDDDVRDDDGVDDEERDEDGVDDEDGDDEDRDDDGVDEADRDDEDRDDDGVDEADRDDEDRDGVERDEDRDEPGDDRDELAREEAGLRAGEEDASDAIFRVPDAVERRAAGFSAVDVLAAVRRAGPEPPSGPTSSAETRFARPSTSLRSPLSSSSTRSSSTSRMRFAAAVTSFARPRVDLAPSAEAVNVRSTAARTASTASAAPAAAFLPLFFESFLAMAARS